MRAFLANKTILISFLALSVGAICSLLLLSFSLPSEDKDPRSATPRLFTSQKDRDIRPDLVIWVKDQDCFERLQHSMNQALNDGKKRIEVRFLSGQYYFNQRHLTLNNKVCPDVSIRFVGVNCTLVPKGQEIIVGQRPSAPLDYRCSYMTADGRDISFWTPLYATDSLIQVVNQQEKRCRIHIPANCNLDFSSFIGSYLQYTEWYYSRVCKIENIGDGWIYFSVPELFKVNEYFNVNYDYRWHKRMPRFRLFHAQIDLSNAPIDAASIHEGQAGSFCRITNSNFKSISFEGFKVLGNNAGDFVFCTANSTFDDYFLIYGCRFVGQRGRVAYLSKSKNIFIQNCGFYDQYSVILTTDSYCVCTEFYNNHFENCGLGISTDICIRCCGQDYLIKENTFKDFGYKAIAVGLGYNASQPIPHRGIIESNKIYYTDDYVKDIDQHGLIDSGAISIGPINDNVVVRYNYINNISGAGSNRGIYCDDGAKNFFLYGNIVLNIHNSKCIDARYDPALEKYDKTQVSNVNKVVKYNIVNGGIKMQGKPTENNGCIKEKNFLLYKGNDSPVFDMVIDNVEIVEDDIFLPYKRTNDLSFVVERSTYRKLRKSPIYRNIKEYIKVKCK